MKIRLRKYLNYCLPVLFVMSPFDILKAQVNPFFAPTVGGSAAGTGNTALSVTGVGGRSLSSGNSGVNNSGFGAYSLSENTTGTENTALGAFSLMKNTTGKFNTAAGTSALLRNVSGRNNNSFGWWSMRAITSGNYNCAFGNSTLRYAISGNGNTAIGDSAATNFTTYSYCTFLGKQADATAAGFHNAIAIGFESRVDASNKVVIGNRMVQSIGGWSNWTNLSDRRIKTNINKSKLGLDFILSLNPVTYNYTVEGQKDILQTGLIAQEVDEAAKKAGVDFSGVDKTGEYWGIRYATLTVPLIKAMQEMEEKHKAELEILYSRIETLEKKLAGIQPVSTSEEKQRILFQNNPNPFNQSTTIRYQLKQGDEKAAILIRDLNGALLKQININRTGSIPLQANELKAGTYTYTLIVNGESADTKLMVLLK